MAVVHFSMGVLKTVYECKKCIRLNRRFEFAFVCVVCGSRAWRKRQKNSATQHPQESLYRDLIGSKQNNHDKKQQQQQQQRITTTKNNHCLFSQGHIDPGSRLILF